MKSVKMDFVRAGEDAAVLTKGWTYHVVIDSLRHRQFVMPLGQQEFVRRLAELRYHRLVSVERREEALIRLSDLVTEILEPPEVAPGGELVQLDLVTGAHELWALPFEAALGRDLQPLFARREPAMVLTRRAPQQLAERQPNWPPRPRILFAYASPAWAGGAAVPAAAHREALLSALQPWVEPFPDAPLPMGEETSVLTTLQEASLIDIEWACRQAEAEGRPYTHVHLLAHGVLIQDPVYQDEKRYGVALAAPDERPTEPEEIVRSLRPPDATGQDLSLVVTLAICDGGNAANSIIEAGGLAQELHRAGIPIVLASQLPLTFPGSEILVRVFYQGWMAGEDARAALHETRVALYEAEGAGHDWVSLVAYARLPEGYGDYLFKVRLESQLAALETASRYDRRLLEKGITDPGPYDRVADQLGRCIAMLERLLADDAAVYKTKQEVEEENTGLLGSAYKRLAELLAARAAEPERRDHWRAESLSALSKARDVYRAGFLRHPAHHWSGVQYLALDAILTGRISNVAHWYACYVAAVAQRDQDGEDEKNRIWALGSIAELGLLAPLAPGVVLLPDEAPTVNLARLCERVTAARDLFTLLSPIESTRRQLMRYVKWWTKANGFFESRDGDLAEGARTLAELLGSHGKIPGAV